MDLCSGISPKASSQDVIGDAPWFIPIVEFAGHILGGTAIFLLIAGAGWLIHRVTTAVGTDNVVLHYGLIVSEFIVFAADSLLFILFVLRSFWRAARKLVRGFAND
jgi:hypothetical protein